MAWEEWGTFSVLEVVSKGKIDEFNVVVHYIVCTLEDVLFFQI